MTLDQLQVLQTIVRTGSFRAASQELHRAQSAVSYAIRSLEDEVGFSIFNRAKYRPEITPQGRAFLKKTEDLIFQYSELQETAELLKRGHEPLIRIAVSTLWPLPKLTAMLKEFYKVFPHTEIKIVNDVLSLDEQIIEDRADIGIGSIFNDKGLLRAQELFTIPMPAVCSAKHPLAKLKNKATDEDFAKYHQIILSSTLQSANRSGGIVNPHHVISVQDYLTKKAFIEAGLGWGLMPEHLVKEEIKQKTLVTLSQKPYVAHMHLARHSAKESGPCGNFIWNYFSRGQKTAGK